MSTGAKFEQRLTADPSPSDERPANPAIGSAGMRRQASILLEALRSASEGSHQLEIRREKRVSGVQSVVFLDGSPILTLPPPEELPALLAELDAATETQHSAYVLPDFLRLR